MLVCVPEDECWQIGGWWEPTAEKCALGAHFTVPTLTTLWHFAAVFRPNLSKYTLLSFACLGKITSNNKQDHSHSVSKDMDGLARQKIKIRCQTKKEQIWQGWSSCQKSCINCWWGDERKMRDDRIAHLPPWLPQNNVNFFREHKSCTSQAVQRWW